MVNAGVPLPSAAEDSPEAMLTSEPQATAAILQLVGCTGLIRGEEQVAREAETRNVWGSKAMRE